MSDRGPTIRLLIVDDHALVRDGLRARLSVVPGLRVIGEATDGVQALELAHHEQPDLMLVDVGMRAMSGIELTTTLRQRHPHIRVLMLSMHGSRVYVMSAIRAGARGYVLKESATEEVIAAIHAVAAGGTYYGSAVAAVLAHAGPTAPPLTAREHEILLLLVHGSSNKVVARRLDIGVRTVETHRLSLRRKLGADSASALLKIALAQGWTIL
jgi:DNA-binding NarL/FixJ family response regulator